MAKCELKVPPKSPEVDDTWTREDGAVFIWTGSKEGWAKKECTNE